NRKIDALADYLVHFSFDTLLKNKKGIVANTKCLPAEKNIEIEHLKALTGLYLSVAYIAVKNIVKTNARYYIAFAAFDRDIHLFSKKLKGDAKFLPKIKDATGKDRDNYFALTQHFLDKDDETDINHVFKLKDGEKFGKAFRSFLKTIKHHFDKKWREIFRNNISEAKTIHETGFLLTSARNNVEHLNVLTELPKYVGDFRKDAKQPMTSYFELFHYLLQRMMTEPDYENGILKLQHFAETLQKYHTPSNDLIKLMFVSFAYNLPRYKNLTIEALFDKDSKSGKKLDEERKWKEDENNKRNN
ncbi:MAG: type VI-D CRISPR-associated RNA-guided ribonuclease Cas13d, partial [Planctomycetaceae bacterium]|nr:type VI-D CRISPR-associated RNA-guided ribonuclease Cas13d [Planctomycetaceae bacterium]